MKYKICPKCGLHNQTDAYDCENPKCRADLFSVRVTDDATEMASQNQVQPRRMIRICEECGFHNPSNARKCQNCEEDIGDITPVEENDEAVHEVLHFVLASLDGEYAYEIQPGKTVIGRRETMAEYLESKVYVSRRHAELVLEDGKLTIQNLSQSNFTYINNEKNVAGTVELHDGDEIGLGGNSLNDQRQEEAAYFMVRIGSCT